MALFNAFQLMLLFSASPFAITYVKDAAFYGHGVLSIVLIISYILGFGSLTVLVSENLNK